jgi:hypothetical protein
MLQGLFGKDNDMLIWIILIIFLLGFNDKDDCFGGHKGGIFGDDMLIWIILLFFLLSDNKDCDHGHGHC